GMFLALAGTLSTALAADAPRTSLRIGGDTASPPYHFLDARGQADGVHAEPAPPVAADPGLVVVCAPGGRSTTLDRMGHGHLDAVPMFWSAAREGRYGLSEPILLRHHALFGHYETPTIASMDDLDKTRVAVQGAGLAWESMLELDRPGITLVVTDNEADTLA